MFLQWLHSYQSYSYISSLVFYCWRQWQWQQEWQQQWQWQEKREGKGSHYRIITIKNMWASEATWKWLHHNHSYLIHLMAFSLIMRNFVEFYILKALHRYVIISDDNLIIYLNTWKTFLLIRTLSVLIFIFITYFWNTILSIGTGQGSFVFFFLHLYFILRESLI